VWTFSAVLQKAKRVPAGFDDSKSRSPTIYYGNFLGVPVAARCWAIEQVFPIIPVHRHSEQPRRRAILADITCDSDGKIDRFNRSGAACGARCPCTVRRSKPYYFGVFPPRWAPTGNPRRLHN